jgi:hypothetical protein
MGRLRCRHRDRIVDPAQPVLDRATLGEVGAVTQLAGRCGQPRGGGHAGQGVPGIQVGGGVQVGELG